MIKNKETFLKKVALMPELKGNKLSLVFALRPSIDVSNKTKFVENVSTYFIMQKEEDREKINLDSEKETDIEKWLGKDLRIKKVKLNSVRCFPKSSIPAVGSIKTGQSLFHSKITHFYFTHLIYF